MQIGELLADPTCHLLTLLGPGGIGKTRLSLAAAEQSASAFRDGKYFVPFLGVQIAETVASVIADALNIVLHGTMDPAHQLFERLHNKQILMILDNMEHLLDGQGIDTITQFLTSLIEAAPDSKIMVTSRGLLRMREEWVYPVHGLPFILHEEDTIMCAAAELFVARARQASTGFSPEQEWANLQRICQMVEGNPLALELAASWTGTLSCADIAAQIERDIRFLASRQYNVSQRHASIQAVFEQSWARLSADQQVVLRRMTVFRGGCALDAAQSVAAATLPELAALIGQSMLHRNQSGRYELHELLRQFAAEKFGEDFGDRDQTINRHAAYYLALLYRLTPDLQGRQQKKALEILAADIQNIFAAWRSSVEMQRTQLLMDAAYALFHFCELTGRFNDGLILFRLAAERFRRELEPLLVARMQIGQGMCTLRLGRFAEAQALLDECVANLRPAETQVAQQTLAVGLYWLAHSYFFRGQYEHARQLFEESLHLFTILDDIWGMGAASYMLGMTRFYQGALGEASRHLEIAERRLRSLGERRLVAFCVSSRGAIALLQGDYERARQHLLDGVAIRRTLNDPWGIGYATRDLGYVALAQGDYVAAKAYLEESLEAFEMTGAYGNTILPLDALGAVARLQGAFGHAEELHQRALAISQETHESRAEALCRYSLGRLAMCQGDASAAEEHLHASLAICTQIGYQVGSGYALCHLGVLLGRNMERRDEAAACILRALDFGEEIGVTPIILDALLALAGLLLEGNSTEEDAALAVVLLNQVRGHPASTQEMRVQAEQHAMRFEFPSSSDEQQDLHESMIAARKKLYVWTVATQTASTGVTPKTSADSSGLLDPLTAREISVLRLIEQGLSNREIAEKLVLTVGSVKWYTHQIFGKLGAKNRSEAILTARQAGLLS
jgi:predicted ATPase/DNA-binding CsgD family transcriptional regulator